MLNRCGERRDGWIYILVFGGIVVAEEFPSSVRAPRGADVRSHYPAANFPVGKDDLLRTLEYVHQCQYIVLRK